ncbi:MAG TPA: hypothetical protein VD735_00960 [Candidatus Saccharimonadales bacterium]|nr:hypothetical protein [Candidatus Saccharimonadales bacterium]
MSSHPEIPLTPYQEARAEDQAEQILLRQFGDRGLRGLEEAYAVAAERAHRYGLEAPGHHLYDDMADAEQAPSALLAGATEHLHTPLVLSGRAAARAVADRAEQLRIERRDMRILAAHVRNPDVLHEPDVLHQDN